MGKILLVHPSKVIRSTLARHLEADFQIVEAMDGESAWQLLVLDHDLVAVITGPDISRLGGLDLLERLRRNRLQRLKRVPFYFVGSETRLAEITPEAEKQGVTGFILNGMGKSEILQLLLPHKTIPNPVHEPTPSPSKGGGGFRDPGLLSRSLLEAGVRRIFSGSGDRGAILFFGVDAYDDLEKRLGKGVAGRIAEKFARLVQGKLGSSDFIGHYRPGCFAIVSRSSRLEQCAAFASRVAKSVAAARIVVQEQPLSLSLSAGAASRPEDGDIPGDALLALALARMERAMAEGGGQVLIHGEGRPARRA